MTQSHFKKLSSGQCSLEGNHNNKLIHQQKQNKKRKIKKKSRKRWYIGFVLAGSDFQKKTVLYLLMYLLNTFDNYQFLKIPWEEPWSGINKRQTI